MKTLKLTKPTTSQRKLPNNFQPEDIEVFQHSLEQNVPASELLQFENVTAMGSGWLYQGATLIDESFAPNRIPSNPRKLRSLARMFLTGLIAPRSDCGIWFTDDFSNNYYHWLTDSIPRLYVSREQGIDAPILLPGKLKNKQYVLESIELFQNGAPIFIPDRMALKVKELMLPTYVGETYNTNEVVMRNVGQMFKEHFVNSVKKNQRTYISRANVPRRNIANESDLLPVLEKYGFQIAHFEKMSFREQIGLAASSSIMVGPHGAGLANMLFMHEGMTIIEIIGKSDYNSPCFFNLASALNHDYYYIMGSQFAGHRKNEIFLEPIMLEQTIIEALDSR